MLRLVLAAVSLLVLFPSAAIAQWRVAESRHFSIYSEGSPEEIEKLADRLESYDKLMRMATRVPSDLPPVKIRIYQVRDLGDVQKAANMDQGSGVAGFYNSNILGPYLVTPRKAKLTKDVTPELVLQHEYAHHFSFQYIPAVYPSWYTEGFAELIGSSKMLEDGRIGYGMPAKHRGNDLLAHWVPLQEVLTEEKLRHFDRYGQGWAITHFFTFNRERAKQLERYFEALTTGSSMQEAARVFGDLSALNREARRYVGKGYFEYRPVRVEIRRPVIQSIRLASAGEADLVTEAASFRDEDLNFIKNPGWRNRERQFRQRVLESIRAKAARHSRDVYPQYLLAEAESASGNYQAAEAAADRALALQPNHVRAMARKSILMSRKAALTGPQRPARAAEARRLAVKANRLDTEDPLPLIAFYESFRLVGETPTGPAVLGLKKAAETYPLDMNIRQLLVDSLAANGRYAEAISWLQAIANDPHDSPRRQAAREQRAKLEALVPQQQAKSGSP